MLEIMEQNQCQNLELLFSWPDSLEQNQCQNSLLNVFFCFFHRLFSWSRSFLVVFLQGLFSWSLLSFHGLFSLYGMVFGHIYSPRCFFPAYFALLLCLLNLATYFAFQFTHFAPTLLFFIVIKIHEQSCIVEFQVAHSLPKMTTAEL